MAEVSRKGRGFAHESRESTDGRLERPIFTDEGPDRDGVVLTTKRRSVTDRRRDHRPSITSSPPESNGGGVTLPPTSQSQGLEKPPRKVKPAMGIFTPPHRRQSLSSEQQQTIHKPGVDYSGMDFSRATRVSPQVQTLTQALRSQSIGSGKSKEQAPSVGGLRLEGPPTEPKAPPTEPKAPHATPVPTRVLTEALKSLPPKASPTREFRNSAIPSGPAAAIQVAEVVTQEISLQDEPTVSHSSETPAVVTVGAPQHHEPTTGSSLEISAVATGVTTDIQVEESLASTANMISATEELESYQLEAGERFASESSDESESVTSTIYDYDNVSEDGSGSGDEIVRKKTRKPKPVETSDGKVYYPIAVDEEPYVPLTYGIPPEDFTRLSSLKDDSKLKYWTYDLYQHEEKRVSVECCTTLEEFETAAQKFLTEKAIGFDMEWLPRPSKTVWDNVSLIQLAKEDHIALFHLGRLQKEKVEELVPPSLRTILESKDILKVGVSVGGDGSRIKKWLGIEPQGLMELSAIHHVIGFATERRRGNIPRVLVSLARLSEEYLRLPIHKGFVRISDWTKPLTPSQITYAATDAYAGLMIFDALQRARMLIDPIPMLPACVKCGEDKKKRGVVTPKLYIDGVEAGTNPVSTWNTNFEGTANTTREDLSMDWAQEVEDSRVRDEAAVVKKPKKRVRNTKTANANGEASSNRHSSAQTSAKPALSPSPDVEFATDWANKYISQRTVGSAKPYMLKAYALWHEKEYTVEDTAKHLGVSVGTAAGYISSAVRVDQLAHDKGRMIIVWSMSTKPKPRRKFMGMARKL